MLKNATLRQLSALHAVARLGSVSRAASEINLTQPAVSIQLKLLEESAGTPLIEREGRGIRLTSAGELMADYAGRILDLWREVGDEMAAHRGVMSRRLRIGVVTTAEYLVPRMLIVFSRDCPNVEVKLKVGNRDEVVRLLASHEVDLVIMGRPPKELKTVAAPFARHTMAFIAAPAHPLMSRGKLALKDLAGKTCWCASVAPVPAPRLSSCSATPNSTCASAPSCRATKRSSRCARRASVWPSCRSTSADTNWNPASWPCCR
jgi:DNA-binding transcriptional LysR family regulator